jgi:copper transport protein
VRARILLLGLILFWCGLPLPRALAHGVLQRSIPAANTVLQESPRRITLWFSEPVDPNVSAVAVEGAGGVRQEGRPAVGAGGRQITLPVDTLPRGVYTVRWRVLSRIDGHISSGFFIFAVGQALPAGHAAPAAAQPEMSRAVLRWLGMLTALFLSGIVLFRAAVLTPVLRRLSPAEVVHSVAAVHPPLRRAGLLAAAGLLIVLALEVGQHVAALIEIPNPAAGSAGAVWALVAGTRAGWSLLARFALTVILMVLLGRPRRSVPVWAPAVAAAALPAGLTIASHAAGGGAVALGLDWLHMAAVAVWIGGVAGLLIVVMAVPSASRTRLAQILVPRFSKIAAACLATVVLTGVLGAARYVSDLRAAAGTPYGRTLFLKIVLAAALVGLGAVNRAVVRPGLTGDRGGHGVATRRLLRVSAGEVALGSAILFVVAVLTLIPPATSAAPGAKTHVVLAGIADDLNVRLTVTPAAPGWNRLDVTADGPRGSPVGVDAVLVRLLKLDEALEPRTVTLAAAAPGAFAAEGGDLGVAGWWQVEVVARRAGRLDVSAVFPLWIEGAPGSGPAVRICDPQALRLLAETRAAWSEVRTWRETQQLTDGAGSVYLTWVEAEHPDRQRFRTSTGVEVVVLGAVRYQRTGGGPWKRYVFAAPVPVEGPVYFLRDAHDATLGRAGVCGGEPCRVLFWVSPDGGARFAAWVGMRTRRPHTLFMLEPTHYMTLQYSHVNEPVAIHRPE